MDMQQLLLKLDEILELKPGTLKGDEQLADLEQWDSLAMMNFIALASERGVALSPRQFTRCNTVNDLLMLTEKQPS